MRRLLPLLLFSACLAPAASFSLPVSWFLHPARAWHNASGAYRLLLISGTLVELTNAGDYLTTLSGPVRHPAEFCEKSLLLSSSPCVVSLSQFTAVKSAIALSGIVEWTPVWSDRAGRRYAIVLSGINFGLSAALGAADVHNLHVLLH